MATLNPPSLRFESGVFVVGLGDDFSHLHENVLNELQLLTLLAASIQPACLVVDMTHVKFIGSAAIGRFVSVSRALSSRGGRFGLLNANQFCSTAISMAKLSGLIPVFQSVGDVAGVS